MISKSKLLSYHCFKRIQTAFFSQAIQSTRYPPHKTSLDTWGYKEREKKNPLIVNPDETTVILFPGQGSQFVGMGQQLVDIPKAKQLYDISSDILGYDLLDLCLNGPKDKLDRTEYCQPAIFVTSLASLEKLKQDSPQSIERCIVTAGFSVGELTSLVFSGAIKFENALRLVKIRAEAMQHASEIIPSGMMTVFYHPSAKLNFACLAAKQWCIRQNIEPVECIVANHLMPSCKVIAGNIEALKFIELNAADFGIKRVKYLPVSGAFHSHLMKPAVEVLQKALEKTTIVEPTISTYSNAEGKRYRNPEKIRKLLLKQVYSPVKWEQIVTDIYNRDPDLDCPHTFECGPGKHLMSIMKQCNGKAWKKMKSIGV